MHENVLEFHREKLQNVAELLAFVDRHEEKLLPAR